MPTQRQAWLILRLRQLQEAVLHKALSTPSPLIRALPKQRGEVRLQAPLPQGQQKYTEVWAHQTVSPNCQQFRAFKPQNQSERIHSQGQGLLPPAFQGKASEAAQ